MRSSLSSLAHVTVILIIANIYWVLKYFICVNSLNSQNSTIQLSILTILILQKRKMRHCEVKKLVQRCTASENLNLGSLAGKPTCSTR